MIGRPYGAESWAGGKGGNPVHAAFAPSGKGCNFSIIPPEVPAEMCRLRYWGGINVLIAHWTLLFLCTAYASPVVFLIAMLGTSLGLIPISDWYGLNRAARRESSVENLEAWFALEGNREIDHSQTPQLRGPRG